MEEQVFLAYSGSAEGKDSVRANLVQLAKEYRQRISHLLGFTQARPCLHWKVDPAFFKGEKYLEEFISKALAIPNVTLGSGCPVCHGKTVSRN
ncbi:MAG TPA: hypothetical protein VE973_00200 [Candidatus Limnocylindria bacterium]|nr:hypothetical protein [Candidatus Limnocylindria bacterium]